jgi:6-pyruvoyl-tetrahydropterin synthase related domain
MNSRPSAERPSHPFSPNISNLWIIGVAAVVLAVPMLGYGPMPQGHDTDEHLNFARYFGEQFWGGEWYPRWLIGMNHGLGSPTFFVYPPLPSYVCALLQPVAKVCHFNAFNMGEFLALFASGICAFLWLNTMASRRVALAGAVLYMLAPYHLTVDYYRRTALAECWAFVWMPLVLYFTTRITRREHFALAGLAASYALLILSHFVSVLIFSLIPLAAALAFSVREQRARSTLHVAAGMLIGAGLASFYLVPMLFYARYFPVSRLGLSPGVGENLIGLATPSGANAGFVRAVSLTAIDTIALCVLCGGIVLAKGLLDSRKKVLFWFVLCVVPVFLMSRLSFRVWRAFPPLLAAVQFPYRFNIVLCLAAVAIVAVFFSELSRLPRLWGAFSLPLVLVLIGTWLAGYGSVCRRYHAEMVPQSGAASLASRFGSDDGWFFAWTPPGFDKAKALQASDGPRVRFLAGNGTAKLLLWKPRLIEFQTDSPSGGPVMINQFYYPAWRAALLSPSLTLETKVAMPEGLLELQVPPGHQQVRLEIPSGRAERAGCWISELFVLLTLGSLGIDRRS